MASDGLDDAMTYLICGGVGEVTVLARQALDAGAPKVQIDTDMALALCLLADEALRKRKAN